MLDGRLRCLSVLDVLRLPDFLGKIEVFPADDGVLNQPPASLGYFLFDLFARQEVRVVPKQDGLRELIGIFTFVQLLFNRLPEFHIINETQNKVGFRDFAEFFKCLIQGWLFRGFCGNFAFGSISGMISRDESGGKDGRATLVVSFTGAHCPQAISLTAVRGSGRLPAASVPRRSTQARRWGPRGSRPHAPVGHHVQPAASGRGAAPQTAGAGGSGRRDETSLKVKGAWRDRYRAVETPGQTIDWLRTAPRDQAAA